MSYFRPAIDAMHGYVPGEQPKDRVFIKLNTNENPYPPSPMVTQALATADLSRLNRYPQPTADAVRQAISEVFGLPMDWILCGNGSDDILTIAIRSFVDQGGRIACMDPTYSLYEVLANIQGAETTLVPLDAHFEIGEELAEKAGDASLLFLTRPNAPTGNAMPLDTVRAVCRNFAGIVFIDEAYADFAGDSCLELVREFDNVIVSRTLSKGYSLAGIRFGWAMAQPTLIDGMMKVKDSYNVNMLTQLCAEAAIRDQAYKLECAQKIIATRTRTVDNLTEKGFEVLPSETNFIFAKPPAPHDSAVFMTQLREKGILIRYFKGERTRDYLRITIGTDDEMDKFFDAISALI